MGGLSGGAGGKEVVGAARGHGSSSSSSRQDHGSHSQTGLEPLFSKQHCSVSVQVTKYGKGECYIHFLRGPPVWEMRYKVEWIGEVPEAGLTKACVAHVDEFVGGRVRLTSKSWNPDEPTQHLVFVNPELKEEIPWCVLLLLILLLLVGLFLVLQSFTLKICMGVCHMSAGPRAGQEERDALAVEPVAFVVGCFCLFCGACNLNVFCKTFRGEPGARYYDIRKSHCSRPAPTLPVFATTNLPSHELIATLSHIIMNRQTNNLLLKPFDNRAVRKGLVVACQLNINGSGLSAGI